MVSIVFMITLVSGTAGFKTKLHMGYRASRRLEETQIRRPGGTLFPLLGKLPLLAGLATVLFAITALGTTPNYVQGNSAVPQTPQTKVTVTYSLAQSVGDLDVVI